MEGVKVCRVRGEALCVGDTRGWNEAPEQSLT